MINAPTWNFAGAGRVCYFSARYPGQGFDPIEINEQVRKCVTFIGILDDGRHFVPYGTACIVGWPNLAYPVDADTHHG